MPPCCQASTSTPPRGSATLPGSMARPEGPPGRPFPIAITGDRMTLGNGMFIVSVWHRRGHHVTADAAPPLCKRSAGVAAKADHAMVCEKVAKMPQMRHDNLANALSSLPAAPG